MVITGSTPSLTAWGDGLAMAPLLENPLIWTITVDMPFGFSDTSPQGIFSFRYEIVTATERIMEGQNDRVEQSIQHTSFHIFRSNYRYARFKGWTALTGKAAFMQFCSMHIDRFRRGVYTLPAYFDMHSALVGCLPDAKRGHVEEIMEETLQDETSRVSGGGVYCSGGCVGGWRVDVSSCLGCNGSRVCRVRKLMAFCCWSFWDPSVCLGKCCIIILFNSTYIYIHSSIHLCLYLFTLTNTSLLTHHSLPPPTGSFGVTSDENIYAAGTGGYTSYSYVNGVQIANPVYAPTTVTKRKPPKPTLWAYFTARNLDVSGLFGVKWSEEFGEHYRWIVRGVAEVVERFAEHGMYDWVRIMPLVAKHNVKPRILLYPRSVTGRDANRESPEETRFVEVVPSVCGMIKEQVQLATTYRGNKATEGLATSSTSLAREWLRTILLYAPSLPTLTGLLLNAGQESLGAVAVSCRPLEAELVTSMSARVETEDWSSKTLSHLEDLLRSVRPLASPRIASALLKNSSVDNETSALVNLIMMCLQGLSWQRQAAASEEKKNSGESVQDVAPASAIGTTLSVPSVPTSDGGPVSDEVGAASSGLEGEWHELNVAAKEWIARKHKAEPAPEMVTVEVDRNTRSTNPYNWPFSGWSQNQVEKRPKRLTVAEQKQQYRSHFQQALIDIEAIFTIPFFFANPNGILFELGRCWFLKGNTDKQQLLVLDALCVIGDRNGSRGFTAFPSPLAQYMEARTFRQLKDSATSSITNSIHTVQTIADIFGKRDPLGHRLVHYLCALVGWAQLAPESVPRGKPPALVVVLEKAEFWEAVHMWASYDAPESDLVLLLQAIRQLLVDVANSISHDTCRVSDMHAVIRYEQSFISLLNTLQAVQSCPSFHENLPSATQKLRDFDTMLEYVQIYISFFCTCGTKIDVTDIRSRVEMLRHRYSSLKLNELSRAFDGILVMPHVSWLYQLRGSELFLKQWRRVGQQLCVDSVEGAREVLAGGGEETPEDGMADAHDAELAQLQRGDGETDDEFAGRVAVLEAAIMARVNAQFQVQDRRNDILQRVDEVVLSQEDVVNRLIPVVKTAWSDLATSTFTGMITIASLDEYFATMTSELQIAEELRLLSTCDFTSADLQNVSTSDFVERSLFKINDYHLLRKLRGWLPGLIKLHEALQSLFETSLESDQFRVTLEQTYHTISTQYDDLILMLIPPMVESLKGTFDRYHPDQLDFLTLFSGCPALISWLLNQSSTEEFNRLLQVVRPCTDEPRMLSAIASLVHIRTMLISILYVPTPYDSLESFLDTFGDDIELQGSSESGSALWHLSNIISTFDGLMEVFEKQTRSPGGHMHLCIAWGVI